MIRSMTGFFKTEVHYDNLSCSIEVRSVNHRYCEIRVKLPPQFKCFESELVREAKSLIARGKVDIDIALEHGELLEGRYFLNPGIWQNVCELIQSVEKSLDRQVGVSLSDLFGFNDLLVAKSPDIDPKSCRGLFGQAIQKAIAGLIQMREREGQALYGTILEHLARMRDYGKEIQGYRGEVVLKYKQKLQKNLRQIAVNYEENDPRILQEIGLFLDKSDITEEMDRFETHLEHFKELLESNKAVGRKLDFLLQELNREVNTLCSKANHTKIAQYGVELKCEIEKLREQVQNIE